jgi:hypothetical protein
MADAVDHRQVSYEEAKAWADREGKTFQSIQILLVICAYLYICVF